MLILFQTQGITQNVCIYSINFNNLKIGFDFPSFISVSRLGDSETQISEQSFTGSESPRLLMVNDGGKT